MLTSQQARASLWQKCVWEHPCSKGKWSQTYFLRHASMKATRPPSPLLSQCFVILLGFLWRSQLQRTRYEVFGLFFCPAAAWWMLPNW